MLLTGVARATKHAKGTTLFLNSSHAQTQKIREKLAGLTQFLRELQSAPQLTSIERWCRILGRALVKFLDGRNPKLPSNCLPAVNRQTVLSASEYDPPHRWGGVRDPLLLRSRKRPSLITDSADHPRLPFHRCTTKRSFCNQTRWVKLDADFPPSSSLQAFPHTRT